MRMLIGVLSDTHLRYPTAGLERILENVFADANMILHAGDIVALEVLDRLLERGVTAVAGNMDDYDVLGVLPQTRVMEVEGRNIGLIHGWGSMQGLEKRILSRFTDQTVDIVVYGHSHEPFWAEAEGIWMFNPGSVANNRKHAVGTVGMIELHDDKINASIINLDK